MKIINHKRYVDCGENCSFYRQMAQLSKLLNLLKIDTKYVNKENIYKLEQASGTTIYLLHADGSTQQSLKPTETKKKCTSRQKAMESGKEYAQLK